MVGLPENKFGYLRLVETQEDRGVYIKANKIIAITHILPGPGLEGIKSVVWTNDSDETFYVAETVDQIFEQLENIHPSLR